MQNKHFVNEVRGFLFYSKLIWPVHKLFCKSIITPRCKNCIISANHSPLNKEGLCQNCQSTSAEPFDSKSQENQIQLEQDLQKAITETTQNCKSQYDVLILFSGGKDSTYLVKKIMDDYPKLRILLCSVDNTFMSPIANTNIKSLVQQLDLPHITIRPPASLYNKMFRHAFLNLNEKGCSGTVDQFDGDLLHDVARNWAAMNKIPLVLSGCSKTQVERILNLKHFEFPKTFEESRRESIAGINLKSIFSDQEMSYWMNEKGQEGTQRPRLLFPFYVWNLEENEVIKKVTEWGMLMPSANNPLLTNNQLIPTMAMVDMIRFGYSSFEPEFCQMVRKGKADGKFWRNVFELSEYSAKTGKLVSKSVDLTLARLGLTRKDLGLPQ